MASRKEVAEWAGVSEATVSRVLNGVGPIREETRKRVLEAAEKLGYQPSAIAQSFARGRSGNLGVVLPYVPKVHLFSTYYFSEILSGIGEVAREQGYGLLLIFRTPEEASYLSYFRTQKVDACIILGSRSLPEEREALLELKREELPFCVVNQHYEGDGFLEVDADHQTGSYQAVRHLLSEGHRRIAFLNGAPEYSNSGDRLAGYRLALQEEGVELEDGWLLDGNYSRKSGMAAAERVAGLLHRLDAVFAANDRMAIGLMQGLRQQGISAGRDIAIAGCDDSDGARLTDPRLTSVHVPFFEMGRVSAEHLINQLHHKEGERQLPERIILPTHLVIRESCSSIHSKG